MGELFACQYYLLYLFHAHVCSCAHATLQIPVYILGQMVFDIRQHVPDDFTVRLSQKLRGPLDDAALGPPGLDDHQYPVGHGPDDARVGHRDDRRRVDDDVVELCFQISQEAFHLIGV